MLQNLISPKIGLVMVKQQLEKKLKKDVKEYAIFFSKHNNQLHFNVTYHDNKKESLLFDDSSNNLTDIISTQMSNYIEKKNVTIDAFEIELTEANKIQGKIYYQTPENVKEFININI